MYQTHNNESGNYNLAFGAIIVGVFLIIASTIVWLMVKSNSVNQVDNKIEQQHSVVVQSVNSMVDQVVSSQKVIGDYFEKDATRLSMIKDMLVSGDSPSAIMNMLAANSLSTTPELHKQLMQTVTNLSEKRDQKMATLIEMIAARKTMINATIVGNLFLSKIADETKFDKYLPNNKFDKNIQDVELSNVLK